MYLEEKVLEARQNAEKLNDLIIEYTPFIASSAKKVTGRYIHTNTDEMSIEMLAFTEAVNSFDHQKGRFINFAGYVIRRRLIDYFRNISRTSAEVPFSAFNDTDDEGNDIYFDLEDNFHNPSNDPTRLEIESLTVELLIYGISFNDLISVSPKSKKTKDNCLKAIKYALEHREITDQIRRTRLLPIKIFEEKCKLPRKNLERHRKYIIAVIEIMAGDYFYLSEYISGLKDVK